MTVKQFNDQWGKRFLDELTTHKANIIFCFGLTKDNNVKICGTTELSPAELLTALKGIVTILEGNKL